MVTFKLMFRDNPTDILYHFKQDNLILQLSLQSVLHKLYPNSVHYFQIAQDGYLTQSKKPGHDEKHVHVLMRSTCTKFKQCATQIYQQHNIQRVCNMHHDKCKILI